MNQEVITIRGHHLRNLQIWMGRRQELHERIQAGHFENTYFGTNHMIAIENLLDKLQSQPEIPIKIVDMDEDSLCASCITKPCRSYYANYPKAVEFERKDITAYGFIPNQVYTAEQILQAFSKKKITF